MMKLIFSKKKKLYCLYWKKNIDQKCISYLNAHFTYFCKKIIEITEKKHNKNHQTK